jgi:hypothetical protein
LFWKPITSESQNSRQTEIIKFKVKINGIDNKRTIHRTMKERIDSLKTDKNEKPLAK